MPRFFPRLVLSVAVVLSVSGCLTSPPTPMAVACSGDDYYFPRRTFPQAYPASDKMRRRWYSSILTRLEEPSLACGNWQGETYRLIWVPNFGHPVVIRVARRGSRTEVKAFQLSGTGRGDPGALLYHAYRRLSSADWSLLQTLLQRSDFWSLPTSGNMYGAHGEQWIIEGRVTATYHIVDRWSPPAGTYRDLGVFFFDLVGWQRPDSSKY